MDDLNVVWRSWFWNAVSAAILLVLAGIGTYVAFTTSPLAANIIYSAIAVVVWVGFFRTLSLRVAAKPHGIVMRGVTHTTTIPWEEVLEVTSDDLTTGAAGALGASTPVVLRKGKPGQDPKRVQLNVLGNFGLWNGPTVADRAIAGLNARLTEWRRQHNTTAQGHD